MPPIVPDQAASHSMVLPFPPSINGYWRNFRGRQIISKRGRVYRKEVVEQLPRGTFAKIVAPVVIAATFYPPDRRLRDLDNYQKSLLDSLVSAGVLADDSLIHETHLRWGPIVKRGRVTINFWPMELSLWRLT